MEFSDWFLSASSSTALILATAWLCRQLIATILKATVQHEFDEKLEAIRTDFHKSEELFKADLRSKESQIAALQSGALTGMVTRQVALDKRRLEAIDHLWEGVKALAPFKPASMWLKTINFEKALESLSENPRTKGLFEQLSPKLDPRNFPNVDVHKARPYVSEMAWALFCAYQAILIYTTMQFFILQRGLATAAELLDTDKVSKLVLTALPHYQEYVEKHGAKGYPYILETLETEILKELQRMMVGEESDKSNVERAAKIMQEVTRVNEATPKNSGAK